MLGERSLAPGREWETGKLEQGQARQWEKGETKEGARQALTLEEEFGTLEKESSHREEAVENPQQRLEDLDGLHTCITASTSVVLR